MCSRSLEHMRLAGVRSGQAALLAWTVLGMASAWAQEPVAASPAAALAPASGTTTGRPDEAALRVCADPDNPPFSRRDETGFENRIARLLAQDLGRPVRYTWLRDRRGFVRKTLGAGLCDVIIGLPIDMRAVRTSMPYYRSGFYFVVRRDGPQLHAFTDPRLPSLRVGVQLIGIDPGTSPVGYALARHGAREHLLGFTVTEDDTPPAQRMVGAVASGKLDSALVWGPQAGYFVQRASKPLQLTLASAPPDMAGIPFEFSIGMGVRPGDEALLASINTFLLNRRGLIDGILKDYGVPRTDSAEAQP